MYCPKCGSQIPDEAVFCPKCGEQINTPGYTQPQSYTPPQTFVQPQNYQQPQQQYPQPQQQYPQQQPYAPQRYAQQPVGRQGRKGGCLKGLIALAVIAAVLYFGWPYIGKTVEKYIRQFRGEPVTQDGGGDEKGESFQETWQSVFQQLFGKEDKPSDGTEPSGQPGSTGQQPQGNTDTTPGSEPSANQPSGTTEPGSSSSGGNSSGNSGSSSTGNNNQGSSSSGNNNQGSSSSGNNNQGSSSSGNSSSGNSSSGSSTPGNGTWQEDLMPQTTDELTQVIFDDFLYPEVLLEKGAPQDAVGLDIYSAAGAWKYELISDELDYREIGKCTIQIGQSGILFDLYPEFSAYGEDVYATDRDEIGYPTLTGYVDEKVYRFSASEYGMEAVLGMFFSVEGAQFGFGSISAANGNVVTVLLTRP